jgi:hypothetical protein
MKQILFWTICLGGRLPRIASADCLFGKGDFGFGRPLKTFFDWLVKGQPRPSAARFTFSTGNYFNKNLPLVSSGQLGLVTLGIN